MTHPLQQYVERVSILETDIDDVSGEILGNFITRLEQEDILDVQVFPSTSKKNRPAYIIKILSFPENTFRIIEIMIKELGTLGVRFNISNRVCINRRIESRTIEINGKEYEINYKISFIESEKGLEIINIKPEYEDLKRISEETGLTVKKIKIFADAKLKQIQDEFN
jgi:uncharacterized protein (DUF111 family)